MGQPCEGLALDDGALHSTVKAIIGTRSSRTAISRADCILRYLRWTVKEYPDCTSLFSEQLIWMYINRLQSVEASPTCASSFLSACRHAHYVFGVDGLAEACSSRRIQGLSNIMYGQKEPLKQARILTVENLLWLHAQMNSESNHPFGKAFCGYILVCVYGRCRHSDLRMVRSVEIDYDNSGGFIQVNTRNHKNAKTVSLQSVLLPVVLPAVGVTGELWHNDVKRSFDDVD